ncbi:MAG: ATP-binding protein [Candidatus Auribacterota bacterium]|nr:ATP-binding protein [Candidatus Auribacterota bacterium]
MIKRKIELTTIRSLLSRHRVVGIIGARQVGKTTLAREIARSWPKEIHYFDLEDPGDYARLSEPMLILRKTRGLVVIDEIQKYPDLFPVLRVLADRRRSSSRFLILGSASPELLKQTSESLAGRIIYHHLRGFALDEIGNRHYLRLWDRGGLPRSYLARSNEQSMEWRRGFVKTFLERDLPQLGINISSTTMRRFWTMLAHYHGQVWNASEFGRSFGVADTTVRGYLDRLTSALVVRQLLPWHENIAKRQVKSPKVYIADSGLLHTLLNLPNLKDIESHPKVGASWEGFVIEQIIRRLGVEDDECYFWATHTGAELDLLVIRGRRRIGFEIKRTMSPKITRSMRIALDDLKLKRLDVIHAAEHTFLLSEKIRAVSAARLLEDIQPL